MRCEKYRAGIKLNAENCGGQGVSRRSRTDRMASSQWVCYISEAGDVSVSRSLPVRVKTACDMESNVVKPFLKIGDRTAFKIAYRVVV